MANKKIYPWTCMDCGRAMAKKKGSRERLCRCANPVCPTKKQINVKPWSAA